MKGKTNIKESSEAVIKKYWTWKYIFRLLKVTFKSNEGERVSFSECYQFFVLPFTLI